MKSVFKIAAVFLFVAIGCFGLIPTTSATSGVVAEPSAAELASLYGKHCSRCHGGDGRSNTAKGRETDADDLTTSDVQNMTAARMSRIIKNGKGDMPGFPKLTASQIAAIVKHVKSF
ncbi:MAG: cytochrome c [Pyrinomonadaceae bacterium]